MEVSPIILLQITAEKAYSDGVRELEITKMFPSSNMNYVEAPVFTVRNYWNKDLRYELLRTNSVGTWKVEAGVY